MTSVGHQFRLAARRLIRVPGFTVPVLVLLTIGIGVNAAAYSLLRAALLRPLPFQKANELVAPSNLDLPYALGHTLPTQPRALMSEAEGLGVFRSIAAFAVGAVNLEVRQDIRRQSVAFITEQFFTTLGAVPVHGRGFASEEWTAGENRVVILSDRIWRERFNAAANAIGSTVSLQGQPYTIVGVMPPSFRYPGDPDVWAPLVVPIRRETFTAFRLYVPLRFVARLQSRTTLPMARQALAALERQYPSWSSLSRDDMAKLVQPLNRSMIGVKALDPVFVLSAAAVMILAIACANIASLMLVRASVQRQEIAIRFVLGATPRALIAPTVAESLVLVALGIGCAYVLAAWLAGAMATFLPAELRAISPPTLDMGVFVFMALLGLFTAALCLVPHIVAIRRGDLIQHLAGGLHGMTRGGGSLRDGLMVLEIGVAVVLTVATALMLASLRRLVATDTGFHPEGVTTGKVSLPPAIYDLPARRQLVRGTLQRLRRPDIVSAAAIDVLPLSTERVLMQAVTSNRLRPETRFAPNALSFLTTPGYFATLGVPIVAGRDFTWSDGEADPVAIVNRLLASKLHCPISCVGEPIEVDGEHRRVIGVVGDIRVRTLGDTLTAQVYLPLDEIGAVDVSFVIRTVGSGHEAGMAINAAVNGADRRQAAYQLRPLERILGDAGRLRRLTTSLVVAFASIAMILVLAGAFATQTYNMRRRRREFAIRMALGDDAGNLARAVLERCVAVALIGLVIGNGGAFLLAEFLRSQLYGISPHYLWSYVAASGIVLVATIVATLVPAIHVARVSPALVLREVEQL